MRWQLPLPEHLLAELNPSGKPCLLQSSPRSHVWQVEFAGAPAVVKQIVDGPDAADLYARELEGLQLAARVRPPVAPRLLATEPRERVLVLEHLEHQRPADNWVVDYATALARLHSATGPQDVGRLPVWSGPTRDDVSAFLALAEDLAVPAQPRVSAELDALVDRLGQAPGHALLHGDPCPGNDLHTPEGIRFIDFEQASLGSGLVELAYLRIGFPTCWCVTATPEPLLAEAEAAYRATWQAATGTELQGDLTDACAGWLIRGDALVQRAHRGSANHLARIPKRDWSWGTVTARQRLAHRLGVVAGTTVDHPELDALHYLATDLRDRMLTRWPALKPPPSQRP